MAERKPKILLVETDTFLLRLYSRKFLGEGFIVQAVGTGGLAIEEAKKNKQDVIMLEILLPDEDGFSVLKKLKKHKDTTTVPVIILTNVSTAPHREQAKVFGAAAYFVKALHEPSEIVSYIKSLLKIKK